MVYTYKKHLQTSVWGWFSLFIILATALFFRVYGLDKVPPAFFPDEGNIALDAQLLQQGNFYLITPREGGEGSLFAYTLAATFSLFGASIASARGLVVAISVVGIGVVFAFIRQLTATILSQRQAFAVAIVAGLLLSVARWHVSHSRIAFAVNLGLLIQVACFWALWRTLVTRRVFSAIVTGLLLGLTAFTYVPFKLTPLILLIFFLLEAIIHRKTTYFLRTHFKLLLLIAAIGSIFYGTLLTVYVSGGLHEGTGAFTFLSPVINHGDLWGTLIRSAIGNFAGFVPLVRQVMGVPIAHGLDNLSLGLFLIGVVIGVRKRQQPAYLFLGIWWLVMLIPSIIAPEGAMPHLRRAIGTIVPTVAFVGLALVVMLSTIARRYPNRQSLFVVVGVVIALTSTVLLGRDTYLNYYLHQLNSEAAALINHIYDFELADTMATEGDVNTAYILPLDSTVGALYSGGSTLEFLYQNRGKADYAYIWDNQETMFSDVQKLVVDKTRVGVVRWKVSKHTGADPAKIFPYLLEKWGKYQYSTQHKYFDVDYFQLNAPTASISSAPLMTENAIFGKQFTLAGSAFAPSLRTDESVWVELAWQKLEVTALDVQIGLWLEDKNGHIIGQVDKPLLNNSQHLQTSEWAVGETNRDYYLIPVPPGTVPGQYQVKIVLYWLGDGGQSHRLAPIATKVGSDLAYSLGTTQLLPVREPVDVTSLNIPQPITPVSFGDMINLIGYDNEFPLQLRSGDRGTLVLWWRSVADELPSNIAATVQLTDSERTIVLSPPQQLGSDDFPTQMWGKGAVFRQYLDYMLPADTLNGTYQAQIIVTPFESSPVLLGTVVVTGRPRNFEAPQMQYTTDVNFNGMIMLLGYDLSTSPEQNGNVQLTLYWQAQQEMNVAYKVFVHLLNADGQIIAQMDQEPQRGEAATTSWISGEIITDQINIPDVDLSEVAMIRVGLYNPADGSRLLDLRTGGDAISLKW